MTKIVITDGYTLNPGDLSWEQFEKFGELTYYDRTPVELITDRCQGAEIVITNKTPFNEETIASSPTLKLIAVTATGVNVIDVAAAHKHGVKVCNVPVYGTDSVAQHAFALLLELTNAVGEHNTSVQKGQWSRNPDWSYAVRPIIELKDKTLGIVGFGKIGQRVAEMAGVFGMKVIYYNPSPKKSASRAVSLEELFKESDFVSLHCPATADNPGFVNKKLLSTMKPGAYLINTSRGQLINEYDLAEAIKENRIAGAALDVLTKEPPTRDNPLIGLPRCILTPHNAWLSLEARARLLQMTYENVEAFLAGNPINLV